MQESTQSLCRNQQCLLYSRNDVWMYFPFWSGAGYLICGVNFSLSSWSVKIVLSHTVATECFMWQRHSCAHSDTSIGKHTHIVAFSQRCILRPRARSPGPRTQDVVSFWVNIMADSLCFPLLALSVQDHGAETGRLSSVDQLRAQNIWLSASICWRYNMYFFIWFLSTYLPRSLFRFVFFLSPYLSGEFVFVLSSDDNSELWLSTDDSPLNLQLLAWVGKVGMSVIFFKWQEGNFVIL